MRCLVTGAAGFIGSHLCEELLRRGHDVVGLDSLNDVYAAALKRQNIAELMQIERFRLASTDLRSDDIVRHLDDVEVIFHLAAIAGVRASWAGGFRHYTESNILGTQRLLEAARQGSPRRVVYASSSSVYGNAVQYPTSEDDGTRPLSPYGVSKLAGELLCNTYCDALSVDTVSLRYFSVYGPRQRPDMGVHRIIEAARTGTPFTVYGEGNQRRDMTYVSDVVDATIRAAMTSVPAGTVANIAGGSEVTLNELINLIREITGRPVLRRQIESQAGDVERTGGDTSVARQVLGWQPTVDLRHGLELQAAWHERERPSELVTI